MQLMWGAQALSVSAGWRHFPQQHNALEITGVTHGHISLLVADGIWSATTGQVVVIPPFLTHSWVSERGADLVVLHLTETPFERF